MAREEGGGFYQMTGIPLSELAGLFDAIGKRHGDMADGVLRAFGMELLRNITVTTPVKTGRARSNWVVSTQEPSKFVNEEGEFSEAGSLATGLSIMQQITQEANVFLSNNLSYITDLNAGSSRQAPAAFVELTTDQVTGALPDIIREYLKNV